MALEMGTMVLKSGVFTPNDLVKRVDFSWGFNGGLTIKYGKCGVCCGFDYGIFTPNELVKRVNFSWGLNGDARMKCGKWGICCNRNNGVFTPKDMVKRVDFSWGFNGGLTMKYGKLGVCCGFDYGVFTPNELVKRVDLLRIKYGKSDVCCCCCYNNGVSLGERDIRPINDEMPLKSRVDNGYDGIQHVKHSGFHKDLNSLPKPLSASDLSSPCNDGSKVRVAYQGVPGSYSEDAALKAYPNCETVPCDEFEAAFKAVELWLVDKAVLPIENSVGGSIHRNYDLLLRHRLHIVGEVQLEVNHCLLGLPGIRKEDLKRVLSHPQALDQCEKTLSNLGLVRISAEDTAGAAQIVASERARDTGAVASARAAAIYGLNVLAERIQDDADNITRFMILAREPVIPGTDRPYKTSIVFSLEEGPGVLFKALAVFALRNINLTKIESRPQRKRPLRIVDDSNKGSAKYFDYLFYIDFEASMADPRAQFALGHLQEFARFLRVLGCYPMDTITDD